MTLVCDLFHNRAFTKFLLYLLFREIAQRHPGNKKNVYYRTPCNKRLVSGAILNQ